MRYIVTKEIKSETQVVWIFYARDLLFLLLWIVVVEQMKIWVHSTLRIPYFLFSILIGLRLIWRSRENPERRYYQAIALYLTRPKQMAGFLEEMRDEEAKHTKKKRDERHTKEHTRRRL